MLLLTSVQDAADAQPGVAESCIGADSVQQHPAGLPVGPAPAGAAIGRLEQPLS